MPTHILGAGGPGDRERIELATREGWPIPNARRQEAPPERFKIAKALWAKERPHARLRSSTAVYNCVGLVFASRRTWVPPFGDDPDLTPILKRILGDDGYRPLAEWERPAVGDVVVYGQRENSGFSHVGIIVNMELDASFASWKIEVMSKWGLDGEYIHSAADVPLALGKPLVIYTERRVLR